MTGPPPREPEVNKILRLAMKHEGTDIYLEAGTVPAMKLRGERKPIRIPALSQEDIQHLLSPLLDKQQHRSLKETRVIDFTHAVNQGRFQVTVVQRQGRLRLTERRIEMG